MINSESNYKYWAFISYSHQDSRWADWLHKKLETFRIPAELVGKSTELDYSVPKRLFPIFRDRDELPSSSDLGRQIESSLDASRFLIVICSPQSARSIWVNKEVTYFKSLGRENRVLPIIVDGEPNASDKPELGLEEAFPPAIRYKVNTNGDITNIRVEPIAADARAGRDSRDDALLKLVAGISGISFDSLKQRDRLRRRRILQLSAIAISVIFITISGLGLFSYFQWQTANHSLGLAFAEKSSLAYSQLQTNESRLYAAKSLSLLNEYENGDIAAALMGDRIRMPFLERIAKNDQEYSFEALAISPDETKLVGVSGYTVEVWNINNFNESFILETPQARGHRIAFSKNDMKLIVGMQLFRDGDSEKHEAPLVHTGKVELDVIDISRKKNIFKVVLESRAEIASVGMSNDGNSVWIAIGEYVYVFDIDSSQIINKVKYCSISNSGQIMAISDNLKSAACGLSDYDRGSFVGYNVGGFAAQKDKTRDVKYKKFESDKYFRHLSFSDDGKYIVATTDDEVYLFDAESGSVRWKQKTKEAIHALAISRTGHMVATLHVGAITRLWDVSTGSEISKISRNSSVGEDNDVFVENRKMSFSNSGQLLAFFANGSIYVWKVKNNFTPLQKLDFKDWARQPAAWLDKITFSTDGRYLALGSYDGRIVVFDSISRQIVDELSTLVFKRPLDAKLLEYESIRFSRDGNYLFAYDKYGRMVSWWRFGKMQNVVDAAPKKTNIECYSESAYYSPNCEWRLNIEKIYNADLSSSDKYSMVVSKSKSDGVFASINFKSSGVDDAVVTNDGKYVVIGDARGTLRFFDINKLREVALVNVYNSSDPIMGSQIAVALSSDCKRLAFSVADSLEVGVLERPFGDFDRLDWEVEIERISHQTGLKIVGYSAIY